MHSSKSQFICSVHLSFARDFVDVSFANNNNDDDDDDDDDDGDDDKNNNKFTIVVSDLHKWMLGFGASCIVSTGVLLLRRGESGAIEYTGYSKPIRTGNKIRPEGN